MGVGSAGSEQDVAAAEVAVHDPARMQERHAARDLRRRRQQRRPVGLPLRGAPEPGLKMRAQKSAMLPSWAARPARARTGIQG